MNSQYAVVNNAFSQKRMFLFALIYNVFLQIFDLYSTLNSDQFGFEEKNPLIICLSRYMGFETALGFSKLLAVILLFWFYKAYAPKENKVFPILGLCFLSFFMSMIVLINLRLIYIK